MIQVPENQLLCSPVLAVGLRQLLPEVLEAKAIPGGVQTEAASADDGGRRRAGLDKVVPLAYGAQDRVGLWQRFAAVVMSGTRARVCARHQQRTRQLATHAITDGDSASVGASVVLPRRHVLSSGARQFWLETVCSLHTSIALRMPNNT